MTTVEVTVFIVKFRDEAILTDSLSDMYSEAQLRIEVGSEEYEYIKSNLSKFSGDKCLKEQYILRPLAEGKPIHISGEAKDICFTVGEFIVKLESRIIPWD